MRALVFTAMLVKAYAQLQHSSGSSTWWPS